MLVALSLSPDDPTPSTPLSTTDIITRRDGWTPFARRLFLEVLSETGRVTRACEYAQLTKQSAYALRARDPLFAAGWDAACELARAPLADALYERAVDGVTDTITKDGEVVASRHRHDNRLSIAVLHRLDKRCDRAEESGARHLALVRHWDEWMNLVGKGEEAPAGALLELAPRGQLGQLLLGENPIADDGQGVGEGDSKAQYLDLSDRTWRDPHENIWLTDFPPPPGFAGYESRPFDDPEDDEDYERACTAEEVAILEADIAAERAAARAGDEAERDAWFALLRAEAAIQTGEIEEPAPPCVIPAKAGTQRKQKSLDSRLRGKDEKMRTSPS